MKSSREGRFILLMKNTISDSQKIIVSQFLKFAMIGFLNTGIHYLIFLWLFRVVGLYYMLASVIGYCCGLMNSFILNKKWTFKTKGVRKDIEFARFILVNIAALIVNVGTMKYFVSVLKIAPEFSQIGAIGFSMMTNFVGNKFWTFRSQV